MHGDEQEVFADAGYQGAHKREGARSEIRWNIAMRPGKRKALDKSLLKNHLANQVQTINARIRAKVENPFRVIKQQFGFTRVRYKGLVKNTAQIITLFALANLWMVRKKLLAMQA